MPGDNEVSGASGDRNATFRAQIAKFGIKLPPLWQNNIKFSFVQAESNFKLSRITSDITKYNNIVAAIDPETLTAASNILLIPPEQSTYNTLKSRMIQEF